jgi:hypothetical protein
VVDRCVRLDSGKQVRFSTTPVQQSIGYIAEHLELVTDFAEHDAQIASYMRQLGMVPPSALRPPR